MFDCLALYFRFRLRTARGVTKFGGDAVPSAGITKERAKTDEFVIWIDQAGVMSGYCIRVLVHPVVFFTVPLFNPLHYSRVIPCKVLCPALFAVTLNAKAGFAVWTGVAFIDGAFCCPELGNPLQIGRPLDRYVIGAGELFACGWIDVTLCAGFFADSIDPFQDFRLAYILKCAGNFGKYVAACCFAYISRPCRRSQSSAGYLGYQQCKEQEKSGEFGFKAFFCHNVSFQKMAGILIIHRDSFCVQYNTK